VKVRYGNFRTLTRDRTIPEPTQDARAIRRAAGECLKRVPLERRIRLLGVRVSGLCRREDTGSRPPAAAEPGTDATPSLFGDR
jgi:DNA polymerase-4